jgi:hypothetical protein
MKRRVKVKGVLRSVAAILLGLLVLGSWCDDGGESPSEIPSDEEASRQKLVIEAKYYAEVSFEWYDRRDENDGSFQGSIPYGDVYHSEG